VKNLDKRFKKREEQSFPDVDRKREWFMSFRGQAKIVYVVRKAGQSWFMSSKRQAENSLCRIEGRPGCSLCPNEKGRLRVNKNK
jgi:hypothetical protein